MLSNLILKNEIIEKTINKKNLQKKKTNSKKNERGLKFDQKKPNKDEIYKQLYIPNKKKL